MSGIIGKEPFGKSGVVGAFTSVGIDDNSNALAMTIDSSERVGIGTVAPQKLLELVGSNAMVSFVHGAENDAGTMGLQFIHRSDYPGSDYRKTAIVSVADSFRAYGTSDLHFVLDNAQDANPYTVGTDTRMVITNDGKVGIGTATPTYAFHVASEQNGGWLCYLDNGGATAPYGLRIGLNASDNNTTTRFIGCIDTTQYRFIVYSNGSVQNVDGTYGSSLSDERLKIDIKDANSQWADVKNINIINYKR